MSTTNPQTEQPLLALDDLDDLEAPPLPDKEYPRNAMSDVVPTLDDEVRGYRHHPYESGVVEYNVSPGAADAAADLAGELGSEFLEGATSGQDMSDVVASHDDNDEYDELEILLDDDEP